MRTLFSMALVGGLTTWAARFAMQPVRVVQYVEASPPSILRLDVEVLRACPAPGDPFVALLWELDAQIRRGELAEASYTREKRDLAESPAVLEGYTPEIIGPVLRELLPPEARATWRCEHSICAVDARFDAPIDTHGIAKAEAFAGAVNDRFPETASEPLIEDGQALVQVCVLPPHETGESARIRYHRRLARERHLERTPWLD